MSIITEKIKNCNSFSEQFQDSFQKDAQISVVTGFKNKKNSASSLSELRTFRFDNNPDGYKHLLNFAIGEQEEGRELFFVVNELKRDSKRCGDNVVRINNLFIDIDFDKDLSEKEIEEKKYNAVVKLTKGEFKPCRIVYTRHGLHVYYAPDVEVGRSDFGRAQDALQRHIEALGLHPDKVVKDPARLLRVAGVYDCKEGSESYLIHIIHNSTDKISVQELLEKYDTDSITGESSNHKGYIKIKGDKPIKYKEPELPPINNNISYRAELYYNILAQIQADMRYKAQTRISYSEIYDFINNLNLFDALGVNSGEKQAFSCIFHSDERPSAVIFEGDRGNHMYHCHSSHCDAQALNAVQAIARKLGMSRHDLLMNLLRDLGMAPQSKRTYEKAAKIREVAANNLHFLEERFDKYPNMKKILEKYLPAIRKLLKYAGEKHMSDLFVDGKNRQVLYISCQYFAEVVGISESVSQKILSTLQLVGFLNKVREVNIPDELLKRAKEERYKKQQYNLVNFYSMPVYTPELFDQIESVCAQCREHGIVVSNITYDRVMAFMGKTLCMRVYELRHRQEPVSQDTPSESQKNDVSVDFISLGEYVADCFDMIDCDVGLSPPVEPELLYMAYEDEENYYST